MILNKINFPIYGVMILISVFMGALFQALFLRKNKVEHRDIFLFLIMYFFYAIFGGMMLSYLEDGKLGLSSYGGAIGVIIAAIIYEKIKPSNGVFIKATVLALPLIYSISKLGCFFAGCCYGMPYEGSFAIKYSFGEQAGVSLFPVQFAETVMFMALFILCGRMQNHKHIVGITLILMAIAKASLDFLRYSHIGKIVSLNQLISLAFIVIGILILTRKKAVK